MELLDAFEPGGERKGQWKTEHGPRDWGRSAAAWEKMKRTLRDNASSHE